MRSIDSQECDDIYMQLHDKFGKNLSDSFNEDKDKVKAVELKARAPSYLGQIIIENRNIDSYRLELASIFDEVFSDITLSIYFSSCALDIPARIILRRALELGISVVYLWDLPHEFYSWKEHDHDLSFQKMIDHLSSEGYRSFIKSIRTEESTQSVHIDYSEVNTLYRDFSNTIHGKIATFESNLPERFIHNQKDMNEHLDKVENVENFLLQIWEMRFFDLFPELNKRLPALSRFK